MLERRGNRETLKKIFFRGKKRKILSFSSIFVLILLIILFLNSSVKVKSCGDGTADGECSSNNPYFCERGILIKRASICGCPDILSEKGDYCVSEYQSNPKNITLKYVSGGEEKEISFIVYKGMADYLSNLSREIYYKGGEEPSRADFKLKNIDEEQQGELLLPLVIKIQNLAKDETDQVRIAVSLVQNIPFGNSVKMTPFGKKVLGYSRYSYEVLYDNKGVCGEKSELLAFILREMGYGIAFFYFPFENHEALGIKCPEKQSLNNTGYCFIETTGPSIITDNEIEYVNMGRLFSEPDIIIVSDGKSLKEGVYEYKDADNLIAIRNSLEDGGRINFFQRQMLNKLNKRYSLEKIYNP